MTTFKWIVLTCFMFTTVASLRGQYESGISNPGTKELITDFNDDGYRLSTTIHPGDLQEHLSVLASDDYEGRETGTPGIEKAAAYISRVFENLGLPKIGKDQTYFQHVAFTFTSWKKIEVKAGERTYRQLRDFVAFPQYSAHIEKLEAQKISFGGYGIDDARYSDYSWSNAAPVHLVFDGEPVNESGLSALTGNENLSQWSLDWQKKSRAAAEHGVQVLLIVSNDIKKIINDNRRLMVNTITQLGDRSKDEHEGANVLFISPAMAELLIGEKRSSVVAARDALKNDEAREFKALFINTDLVLHQHIDRRIVAGKNMLGYVEGTDKKDELVIVSAHYDHVGKKGASVFNGADDNASGTSTVLEILETLVTAKKLGLGPRRSVLCMLVTGEEKGLLGSQYYSENPLFPIDKTVANVNIDMVGRRDTKYESSEQPYIYVIGSDRLSQDLHDINEAANRRYSGLLLDYKYNDEKDPNKFYYRSDHYNFARKGIPAIFFFNGVHEDYHRATDTIEKIDFKLMSERARLIFQTTWELSNRRDRIRLSDHTTAD